MLAAEGLLGKVQTLCALDCWLDIPNKGGVTVLQLAPTASRCGQSLTVQLEVAVRSVYKVTDCDDRGGSSPLG